MFHAYKVEPDSNLVIRCSDTDILLIALGNITLWLKVGLGNSETFINVSKLYDTLGQLCEAFPGFHAFTRCDFNLAYFKNGKNRPFTISPEFIEAFSKLPKYSYFETNAIFETCDFISDRGKASSSKIKLPVKYRLLYSTSTRFIRS